VSPQLADNDDAPSLSEWFLTVPGIPHDFPRGVLSLPGRGPETSDMVAPALRFDPSFHAQGVTHD
jgi:hypothetical protein